MSDVADQHFIQAQHFAAANQIDHARSAWRSAITARPRFTAALFALGQSHASEGDQVSAYPLLSQAMAAATGDGRAVQLVAPALADVLATAQLRAHDPRVISDLLSCLDQPTVNPQPLAGTIAQALLLAHPDPAKDEEVIGRDPLWVALLTRCINVHLGMERRLTALRAKLLADYGEAAAIPQPAQRAIATLAIQAFAGEYVWSLSKDEEEQAKRTPHPLIAALYRPLIAIGPEREIRKLKKDRLSGILVKRTLSDLLLERELAAQVPSLGDSIGDPVSADVRDQYESNPYPRWHAPPAPRPQPLRDLLAEQPGTDRDALPTTIERVLNAGCGTGYELIGVARTDPTVAITALDLSRASIAYAARMSRKLGVENVRFVQGDILQADQLGEDYDVIYSSGVIHHMARPADGLAALTGVLRPGGVLRLCLYSERARAPINAARDLIAKQGWPATPSGIRAFREAIIADHPDMLGVFAGSVDFSSLSGCRDLVFHVQEHQYRLPIIIRMLEDAGLRLIGIDPPDHVQRMFVDAFPGINSLDVERWDALEWQVPDLFASMFPLWAQKIA